MIKLSCYTVCSIFFATSFCFSQSQDSLTVLHLKGESNLLGEIIFTENNQYWFQLESGDTVIIGKNLVKSTNRMAKGDVNLGGEVSLTFLQKKHPELAKWAQINIDSEQRVIVYTTWSQRYKGRLKTISETGITLEAGNNMNLSFTFEEIKSMLIQERKKPKNRISEDLKDLMPRKLKISPHRIFISPTGFPKIPKQVVYRGSTIYLNEFTFAPNRYFSFGAGTIYTNPMIRFQIAVPVRKYLNIGIGGTITYNFEDEITAATRRNGENKQLRGHYFGILTLGNPDYFLNFVYKSKSEFFLPIPVFIEGFIPFAKSYSFGGGFRIAKKWQLIGETVFYQESKLRKSKKVNFGVRFDIDVHSFGLGLNVIDEEKLETTSIFSRDTFPRTFVNGFYAVRF